MVNPVLMNPELNSSGKQDGSLPGRVNLGALLGYNMCSTLEDRKTIALTQMRDIKLFQMAKTLPRPSNFDGVTNFCVQPVTW